MTKGNDWDDIGETFIQVLNGNDRAALFNEIRGSGRVYNKALSTLSLSSGSGSREETIKVVKAGLKAMELDVIKGVNKFWDEKEENSRGDI